MLEDIKKEDIHIIVTKSVSRFDRDTVDALEALKNKKLLNKSEIYLDSNFPNIKYDTPHKTIPTLKKIAKTLKQSKNVFTSNQPLNNKHGNTVNNITIK